MSNNVGTLFGSDASSSSGSSTPIYYSGYMPEASTWTYTTGSLADPSSSSSNTLTKRYGSGLTVTAASSNLPGITFTPASITAVYRIVARFTAEVSAASGGVFQLTDGSTQIVTAGNGALPAGMSETMVGLYVPGTTSSVTVKIQALNTNAGGGGTTVIGTSSGELTIEWCIEQVH